MVLSSELAGQVITIQPEQREVGEGEKKTETEPVQSSSYAEVQPVVYPAPLRLGLILLSLSLAVFLYGLVSNLLDKQILYFTQ